MFNLKKYSVFLSLLVIALSLMSVPALAGDEISCSRDISTDSVSAGDTFAVTVVLSSTGAYSCPVINEELPAGWTVNTVQDGGAIFKESTFEWMWLASIIPGESKTLVYEVTIPSNEKEGSYNINGEASVSETVIDENGDDEPPRISIPISGDNTIIVTGSSSSENTNDYNVPSSTETSTSSIETISEGALEVSEEENDADSIIEDESTEEVATDEGSSTDVQYQDSEPETPGFELIFAVIGLLMSVYLSKRY
jgi:hypothetical protein